MSRSDRPLWTPPPHPEWLSAVNREGSYFNLPAVVPLDEDSLLAHARRATGLDDFGDELWREPFCVLIKSLEEEAQLTLMGRLMTRSDIVLWLSTRLTVTDTLKKYPQILDEQITAPMVIVGLPRSGTSILFELLSQDPEVGVPLMWEALQPCPPPQAATYKTDARIVQTHRDPIKCMASTTSLMGTLYSMRSDQPFNAQLFDNIIMGEGTAQRLEHVIKQREEGIVPAANITDSRYQDLMDDPMTCIAGIYAHFGMPLSDTARLRMQLYLRAKPKGKFGQHSYAVDQHRARDRRYFKRYQDLYDIPDES
jgi:hypothetical protein